MSESKHTPKPWTVGHFLRDDGSEEPQNRGLYEVEEAHEEVSNLRRDGEDAEALRVAEANRSLIAAAQDLLDALFDVSEVAAALVDGEKCEHGVGICWCPARDSIDAARAALAKARGEEVAP